MAAPGRCGFFVQKKNRFCKMIVGKGKRFCGEHATMEEVGGAKRIPCPLDPKHTVTEDKLEKHLKKCNSREQPRAVYFVENINAGPADVDEDLPQVGLSELSRTQLDSLVDKLKTAVEGLQWDLEDKVLSHVVLQEELSNPKNGGSAHKHLKQQASILGHLEDLGLLRHGRCFVEFGAGRGKLSHWIHEALKTQETLKTQEALKTQVALKTQEDLQLLLVERSSTRFKVDGKHQDSRAEFQRLQIDIQHLDLGKVQLLQQKKLPLVGVGKHLCGAATDLALRCLLETSKVREETQPSPKRLKPSEPAEDFSEPGPGTSPVLGLAVALCCHHRCEWRHYVGQRFFLQRGLGPAEFSAFCRMSSWATCGLRPANQDCPSQEPTNQDCPSQEPTNQDCPAQEPTNQDCPSQEPTNQDCPSQEPTNQDCPAQEPTNQDCPAQEPTNQDCPSQEPANQRAEHEEHEPADETDAISGWSSPGERQQVGRLCKLLIDEGRRDFLKTKGFSSHLIHYVDPQVTLENILLTAVPSSSSAES